MALSYQVIITPDAQRGIQKIVDSLTEEYSLETAFRVYDAILDTIESLKTYPERNDVAENISKRGITYRRIMAKSYRIVYTVNKDKIQVVVVDVDYGPRSPERLIKKFG